MVIIGVYAPSDDAKVQDKENIYDNLTELMENISNRKEVLLIGDLNAGTGCTENSAVMSRYREDHINDNCERLVNFCKELNLKILNGFYKHKAIHKFTWVHPISKLKSIIDYFTYK